MKIKLSNGEHTYTVVNENTKTLVIKLDDGNVIRVHKEKHKHKFVSL